MKVLVHNQVIDIELDPMIGEKKEKYTYCRSDYPSSCLKTSAKHMTFPPTKQQSEREYSTMNRMISFTLILKFCQKQSKVLCPVHAKKIVGISRRTK